MHYEPIERPQERIWERNLNNGSSLIGVVGDGSHTHIGNGFVSIKDEYTGAHIHWNTPRTNY